jgi:hypothetical protein
LIALAILVAIRRFPSMGAADSCPLLSASYVRMQHFVRRTTSYRFRRFGGHVRGEFMQRLYPALHGTLDFYLREAFRKGSVDAMACLPFPRA